MEITVWHSPDCDTRTQNRGTTDKVYACNCHMMVIDHLRAENEELRLKLEDAEEALRRVWLPEKVERIELRAESAEAKLKVAVEALEKIAKHSSGMSCCLNAEQALAKIGETDE